MSLREFLKYWLPVVFWAAFIFYLSSIPSLKTSRDPFWDEILRSFLHFVFYFIFCLLWLRALKSYPKKKKQLLSLFFVFLYSLSDEIHQYFVATRSFQLSDLLIDNLGSLGAVFLLERLLPKAAPRLRKELEKWDLV